LLGGFILSEKSTRLYGRFLLFIAGLGGLIYGIDIGIITAAVLYLEKTISLSLQQESMIVAAVLGGSTLSSLVAGALADWFGRKMLMIVSGVIFVASVGIIYLSQGFVPLLLGRLLQGMAGGLIAVVVPIYLAECLSAKHRGRGTAIFQFMLTFGIVLAALIGFFFTRQAEASISAAAGNADLIRAAANHAWRGMFLTLIYPGLIFFAGSIFLSESPRWLIRKGRTEAAMSALRRSVSEEEAQTEMREMQALTVESKRESESGTWIERLASLRQRKYVVPFVLACIVLSLNQTTGINSVLQYLVIILKQAGMTADHATQGDVAVKVLNCVMTIVAVVLVDRKGRRFLLRLGTAGIVIAFLAAAGIFYHIESERTDVLSEIQQKAGDGHQSLEIPVDASTFGQPVNGRPMALTVLYDAGGGDKVATVLSNDPNPTLKIGDERPKPPMITPVAWMTIKIKRAQYGPVPTETTGWLVTACLGLFIASFASGPGVVVWLMLSELMPTRIRAMGMGIALLLNQGISTMIAAVFLPVVGNHGYYAMFLFWAGCTLLYFLTAAFLLPETKGKTLEEIEMHFAGQGGAAAS
jgi:MFS transporter, SP family, solute carrier family 2 (myo-inositol transporter), member 13